MYPIPGSISTQAQELLCREMAYVIGISEQVFTAQPLPHHTPQLLPVGRKCAPTEETLLVAHLVLNLRLVADVGVSKTVLLLLALLFDVNRCNLK
jgi:hypothetical protein